MGHENVDDVKTQAPRKRVKESQNHNPTSRYRNLAENDSMRSGAPRPAVLQHLVGVVLLLRSRQHAPRFVPREGFLIATDDKLAVFSCCLWLFCLRVASRVTPRKRYGGRFSLPSLMLSYFPLAYRRTTPTSTPTKPPARIHLKQRKADESVLAPMRHMWFPIDT